VQLKGKEREEEADQTSQHRRGADNMKKSEDSRERKGRREGGREEGREGRREEEINLHR